MDVLMTISSPQPRTFWVDVEDIFQYFEINPRPSGIQRLVLELLISLPERARLSTGSPRIALVRHTNDDSLLREVTLDSVVRLFETRSGASAMAEPRIEPLPKRVPERFVGRLRGVVVRQIQRLPPGIAECLIQAGILQLKVLRYARMLAVRVAEPRHQAAAKCAVSPEDLPAGGGFGGQAGDILLIVGAPWVHPDYGAALRRLRARFQIEPAVLLYDLIPARRPEWCTADLAKSFTAWLETTLPQCRHLMAISKATASDVEAYAGEVGIPLAGPVKSVPIGTGFGQNAKLPVTDAPSPAGLPAPGSYALFVSTMEARKNHVLLFRVWRRLLSELPRERVPTLVFAGRVGWLVADLLQQLENTNWLDGKIRLVRDPTDAELTALYRGCQFTVFPSLFEGWGLPISESLALGQPCISSNRTSLPEAGGDLARYFDPENLDDACRVIRAVIEDPAGLEAWRERVAREFRHVPWAHTADAILAACLRPGTPTSMAPLLEKST
jgi:glycosyltransferase involved in cell wall biosynthesis